MNTEGGLGGKGESGMGCSRGRASFNSFTHRKVVGMNTPNFDPMVKYPPYDVSKRSMMEPHRLCPSPRKPHVRSTYNIETLAAIFF